MKRILVIDDDVGVRAAFLAALEYRDYAADDEKATGRAVPGFAFFIDVVFLSPVTSRGASGDVVEWKGVFLD